MQRKSFRHFIIIGRVCKDIQDSFSPYRLDIALCLEGLLVDIQHRRIVDQCKYAYGSQRWCVHDDVTRARYVMIKLNVRH